MKQVRYILLILFQSVTTASATSADALDYVLRSVEYEQSVHTGVFSCIFWDISAWSEILEEDNVRNMVLESSYFAQFPKHVVSGVDFPDFKRLSSYPTMLLIYPGLDVEFVDSNDTVLKLYLSLELIDPATKVLVFVDFEDDELVESVGRHMFLVKFNYFVLLDVNMAALVQCNGVNCWELSSAPHPMLLFTMMYRWMEGRSIVYVKNEDQMPFDWNYKWVQETARYLKTEAIEFKHDCQGIGNVFMKCLKKRGINSIRYDILFTLVSMQKSFHRKYAVLHTSVPQFSVVAVPRDRPLNVAELLLMPFSWQAWTLLSTILIIAEFVRHSFPKLFTNNPTLLVVCGFERYNLHQAGRLEKTVFLSLIILVFLVTNAYETKIVSLMVHRPSVQRIKTLEDLARSNMRFHYDLENAPSFANHSVLGNMIVQGDDLWIFETKPDVAKLWPSYMVNLCNELTFDYQRMQPFYVVLDSTFVIFDIEIYKVQWRSPFLDALRYIHITLVEAGLMDLWKRQYGARMRTLYLGKRPRKDIANKNDLTFDDMQPAWMVLGAGAITSLAAFVAENGKLWLKPLKRWLARVIVLYNLLRNYRWHRVTAMPWIFNRIKNSVVKNVTELCRKHVTIQKKAKLTSLFNRKH